MLLEVDHIGVVATALLLAAVGPVEGAEPPSAPLATIDLATREGVALVKGEWRYSDIKIIEADFKAAGADSQPTGSPVRTYDYTPRAGGKHFDDARWEVIDPATLSQRRSNGRLAFNWYRINLTIPGRVAGFDPTGSTVVFETKVDDYAEVWVDGELPGVARQNGGSVVAGWNAANRLVIGRDVKPGQKIQLALFGINGPISNPPTNYIYLTFICTMRSSSFTKVKPARMQSRRMK
jgi:gluconolactonase